MPELPEVETIRARLEPLVLGRRLDRVVIRDERLTMPLAAKNVAARLEGERIASLERRGKYLIFRFDSGWVLLIHLRMTGTLQHIRDGTTPAADPYRRAVVRLDDGSDVAYRDVRRFGTWLLLERDELDPYLAKRLGEEPLGRRFTAAAFARRLANRRAPIKTVLLDQRTLAGMGNIYADEALWRAGIHPRSPAAQLKPAEVQRLHRAIRRTLQTALALRGSTLRDYRTPDGESGSMQHEFKVYGREGEPCHRCGTPIEKIRAAGRGTSHCPRCQVPAGG